MRDASHLEERHHRRNVSGGAHVVAPASALLEYLPCEHVHVEAQVVQEFAAPGDPVHRIAETLAVSNAIERGPGRGDSEPRVAGIPQQPVNAREPDQELLDRFAMHAPLLQLELLDRPAAVHAEEYLSVSAFERPVRLERRRHGYLRVCQVDHGALSTGSTLRIIAANTGSRFVCLSCARCILLRASPAATLINSSGLLHLRRACFHSARASVSASRSALSAASICS